MKKTYWYDMDELYDLVIKMGGCAVDLPTVISNITLVDSNPGCPDIYVTEMKETPRYSNINKAYKYMVQLVNLYCGDYAEEYHIFSRLSDGWHMRDDNKYGIRKTARHCWSAYRTDHGHDTWLQDSPRLGDLIDIYSTVK